MCGIIQPIDYNAAMTSTGSVGVSEQTSPSLLERARGRDAVAWQRLITLYSPLVFYWCKQAGQDSHAAADTMQDVFLAVSRALDRFDREHAGAFRSWLWTITRNKLRDQARKQQPDAIGGSTAQDYWQNIPENEPHRDGTDSEPTRQLIARALELIRGDFQSTTWSAFEAVVLRERPAAEVAQSLGISVGAVYQARARVLGRLRDELGDLEAEFSRV
jgi:RNA polymerase sigma-70 factor, ECF subfamily